MLTALGSGPPDLYAALPIAGDTIGVRTTSQGETVYYAVLDEPLRDRTADPDQFTAARCGEDSAGRFVWVSDVVFRPITPGAAPHFGMQGFPIELAYVFDSDLRRSDTIAADALDFAASGFIDDIDTAAAPPSAPDARDVDVDFDDHALGASGPAADPPVHAQRRPLIDLPPLADEMDVDQKLLTVPAAAPVTGEDRRSLIDLPPLADELDEDGDLSFTGAAPIRTPAPVAPPAREPEPQRLPPVVSRAAEPRPVARREPVPEQSSSSVPAPSQPAPPGAATKRGGAVDVAGPAPTEDLAAGRTAARPDTTRLALLAAAGLAAAGLVGLIFWAITGRDSGETPSASTSSVSEAPTSSAPPSPPSPSLVAPAASPETVLRLVPAGYPDKTCTPEPAVPLGALAAVTCGLNTDPGGPPVGRYTLVADLPALQAQFAEVTSSTRQQICPGNIQSPGPWRHNATPDQVAGQLYCGLRDDGTPIIAWTDDARLLLSVVDAPPGGEAAAFKWWSSHS